MRSPGGAIIIDPLSRAQEVKSAGKQMVVTRKSAGEQHNTRSGRQQPRAAPKLPKSKALAHSPTSVPPLPSPPGTDSALTGGEGGQQRLTHPSGIPT